MSKHFLCKEDREEFLMEADSIDEAHDECQYWNAVVICEVKVISRDGNKVEYERI